MAVLKAQGVRRILQCFRQLTDASANKQRNVEHALPHVKTHLHVAEKHTFESKNPKLQYEASVFCVFIGS